MRNLLITAEAVARAAHLRTESRGAHTRDDFRDESEEWYQYNIISKKGEDGTMQVVKEKEKIQIRNWKELQMQSWKIWKQKLLKKENHNYGKS